jgi:hypothetical protein
VPVRGQTADPRRGAAHRRQHRQAAGAVAPKGLKLQLSGLLAGPHPFHRVKSIAAGWVRFSGLPRRNAQNTSVKPKPFTWTADRALPHPAAFIEPCLPRPAKQPPAGRGWIHEIALAFGGPWPASPSCLSSRPGPRDRPRHPASADQGRAFEPVGTWGWPGRVSRTILGAAVEVEAVAASSGAAQGRPGAASAWSRSRLGTRARRQARRDADRVRQIPPVRAMAKPTRAGKPTRV